MRTVNEMTETMAYDKDAVKAFAKVIGRRITELRAEHNISAGYLAVLAGISESCLYALENGKTNVTLANLIKICLALDITVNDVIPPEMYIEMLQGASSKPENVQ